MPYVGSDPISTGLSHHKYYCNQILKSIGVKVANSVILRKNDLLDCSEIIASIGLPCMVKPIDVGLSLGTTKVNKANELGDAIGVDAENGVFLDKSCDLTVLKTDLIHNFLQL